MEVLFPLRMANNFFNCPLLPPASVAMILLYSVPHLGRHFILNIASVERRHELRELKKLNLTI